MSVTPTSDSRTTSADTPPASPNKGVGRMSESKRVSSESLHPDFPNAKLLLISCKRPKSFFERTVRELLAGGTDVVVLSALGDAIPMCVQLQSTLEEKKAAVQVKIETTYSPFGQKTTGPPTAGLRIYMKKHSDFKGSRISPGYVSFEEEKGMFTPVYDEDPKERCGSVNAGDHQLHVGGSGCNKAFHEVLTAAGQNVENYQALQKALLKKSITDNEEKESDVDVRAVQLENLEEHTSDLKFALCRNCKALQSRDADGATGSVYLSVFKDSKNPKGKEKNIAMVYVVGPKGTDLPDRDLFLDAVKRTAVNIMTVLCDYNGAVRRQGSQKVVQRMNVCRISMFSGGVFKHSEVSKKEVAKAIISGLEEGYRHGPAPRLNFAFDDDAFKQVWIESTGLDIAELEYPKADSA